MFSEFAKTFLPFSRFFTIQGRGLSLISGRRPFHQQACPGPFSISHSEKIRSKSNRRSRRRKGRNGNGRKEREDRFSALILLERGV